MQVLKSNLHRESAEPPSESNREVERKKKDLKGLLGGERAMMKLGASADVQRCTLSRYELQTSHLHPFAFPSQFNNIVLNK